MVGLRLGLETVVEIERRGGEAQRDAEGSDPSEGFVAFERRGAKGKVTLL